MPILVVNTSYEFSYVILAVRRDVCRVDCGTYTLILTIFFVKVPITPSPLVVVLVPHKTMVHFWIGYPWVSGLARLGSRMIYHPQFSCEGFGLGKDFIRINIMLGTDSDFKFIFQFWLLEYSTRSVPAPVPSLLRAPNIAANNEFSVYLAIKLINKCTPAH